MVLGHRELFPFFIEAMPSRRVPLAFQASDAILVKRSPSLIAVDAANCQLPTKRSRVSSAYCSAGVVGFEPTRLLRLLVFKTSSFDR